MKEADCINSHQEPVPKGRLILAQDVVLGRKQNIG